MKSKLAKNIVTGFGGQLIAIVLGLIVPRLLITNYGSDVNGLLSTVTQIFTYMALLEAGIGQAAKNALYKPINEKNVTARYEMTKDQNIPISNYGITISYLNGILTRCVNMFSEIKK